MRSVCGANGKKASSHSFVLSISFWILVIVLVRCVFFVFTIGLCRANGKALLCIVCCVLFGLRIVSMSEGVLSSHARGHLHYVYVYCALESTGKPLLGVRS